VNLRKQEMLLAGSCGCSEALLTDVHRDVFLFSGIDETLWGKIAPTLRMKSFQDDEVICRKGDPADSLLIIWRGEVDVSRDRIHLVTRRRLEIVGEQALIENGRRGATLVAKGLVQLVAVPAESVQALVRDETFVLNLLRTLSAKLSEATDQRAYRYAVEKLLFTEFRAHVARPVLEELLMRGENYGKPRVIDGVILISDIRGFWMSFTVTAAWLTSSSVTPSWLCGAGHTRQRKTRSATRFCVPVNSLLRRLIFI
jgi:CRP-like cAMP-binding protein